MASINAERAHPRQMLYTASKHAVLGLVRAAALDLGRHGIRVNALAPGPGGDRRACASASDTARPPAAPAEAEALRLLAAETALGRIATEAEVAATAVFLASDMASAITGQLIPIDAGLP